MTKWWTKLVSTYRVCGWTYNGEWGYLRWISWREAKDIVEFHMKDDGRLITATDSDDYMAQRYKGGSVSARAN